MLARQQIFFELDEDMEDCEELTEILSNTHLNNNFLALGREVCLACFVNFLFAYFCGLLCGLLFFVVGYHGTKDTRRHL